MMVAMDETEYDGTSVPMSTAFAEALFAHLHDGKPIKYYRKQLCWFCGQLDQHGTMQACVRCGELFDCHPLLRTLKRELRKIK